MPDRAIDVARDGSVTGCGVGPVPRAARGAEVEAWRRRNERAVASSFVLPVLCPPRVHRRRTAVRLAACGSATPHPDEPAAGVGRPHAPLGSPASVRGIPGVTMPARPPAPGAWAHGIALVWLRWGAARGALDRAGGLPGASVPRMEAKCRTVGATIGMASTVVAGAARTVRGAPSGRGQLVSWRWALCVVAHTAVVTRYLDCKPRRSVRKADGQRAMRHAVVGSCPAQGGPRRIDATNDGQPDDRPWAVVSPAEHRRQTKRAHPVPLAVQNAVFTRIRFVVTAVGACRSGSVVDLRANSGRIKTLPRRAFPPPWRGHRGAIASRWPRTERHRPVRSRTRLLGRAESQVRSHGGPVQRFVGEPTDRPPLPDRRG